MLNTPNAMPRNKKTGSLHAPIISFSNSRPQRAGSRWRPAPSSLRQRHGRRPLAAAPSPSDTAQRRLLESARAHGLEAFGALSDTNIAYDGAWLSVINRIQPEVVDAGRRGSSQERLMPRLGINAQAHRGPHGNKHVFWQRGEGTAAKPGEVAVWCDGKPSDQAALRSAAALVAEGHGLFLLGPLWLAGRGFPAQMGGTERVHGRLCDEVNLWIAPGLGQVARDRVSICIDRDDAVTRRLRFSLEGFAGTRGTVTEVDTFEHRRPWGVLWPMRSYEEVVHPLRLPAHDWSITGLDLNRGYTPDGLRGPALTGTAVAPAARLPARPSCVVLLWVPGDDPVARPMPAQASRAGGHSGSGSIPHGILANLSIARWSVWHAAGVFGHHTPVTVPGPASATFNVRSAAMPHSISRLAAYAAGLAMAAAGATVQAQNQQVVLAPTADVTIFSSGDNVADARGTYVWTSVLASGTRRRMLLRFELGAIPPGSQVREVKLELYQSRARGDHDVRVHRMQSSWTTGTSDGGGQGEGAPATPGDVTWGFRSWSAAPGAGTPWVTAGGDFDAMPSAAIRVPATQQRYLWQSLPPESGGVHPKMTSDVQGWIDNPAVNHGWILIGDEAAEQNAKRFQSTRSGAEAPSLTLVFAPAAAAADGDVPLPTWAIAALGASMAAALLKARRRRGS